MTFPYQIIFRQDLALDDEGYKGRKTTSPIRTPVLTEFFLLCLKYI